MGQGMDHPILEHKTYMSKQTPQTSLKAQLNLGFSLSFWKIRRRIDEPWDQPANYCALESPYRDVIRSYALQKDE